MKKFFQKLFRKFYKPVLDDSGFRDELPKHIIIPKPWGEEEILIQTKNYVGKILRIKQGHRLSLQYHEFKEETIYGLSGNLFVDNGGSLENGKDLVRHVIHPGEIHHVPPLTVHRFSAVIDDVEVLEISTPELDDVIRLEDDYKRV